ncbi:MAG: hypothetical protein ABIP71_06280 [Verrucomicrobiota bacterium]
MKPSKWLIQKIWFVVPVIGVIVGCAFLFVARHEGRELSTWRAAGLVIFIATWFVICAALAGFIGSRLLLFLLRKNKH